MDICVYRYICIQVYRYICIDIYVYIYIDGVVSGYLGIGRGCGRLPPPAGRNRRETQLTGKQTLIH